MTRMTQAVFASLFVLASAATSQAATLACTGTAFGQKFSVTGELDQKAETFTFSQEKYGETVKVTQPLAQSVHQLCGEAKDVLNDRVYSFEVTEGYIWGEYLLQLPIDAIQEGSSFVGNLHSCQFDGGWSSYDDAPVQCSLK